MSSTPMVRTGLLHAGSAVAGAVATVGFMSSHAVDLYAIWDQLNDVIAGITKLIALLTPIITGGYGIYKATTASKLKDLAKDTAVTEIKVTDPALAAAIPSAKVTAS